jgi:sugar phosphate isomerase/epimerase
VRIGIDSYSYHRLLGDVRPGEDAPQAVFSNGSLDVLAEGRRLGVDVVSLETLFLPPPNALDAVRVREAAGPVEIALSWGHWEGLEFGANEGALTDLLAWLRLAPALDCRLVRVVAAGPRLLGAEPLALQVSRTAPLLRAACAGAREVGVELALENHGDLTADGVLALIRSVDDPALGVCVDTANAVRVGDDPLEATERLAALVRMVHLKDCAPFDGDLAAGPRSVVYGEGVIPLAEILEALERSRFDGPVCVELAQLPAGDVDERTMVADCVRWLRERLRGAA